MVVNPKVLKAGRLNNLWIKVVNEDSNLDDSRLKWFLWPGLTWLAQLEAEDLNNGEGLEKDKFFGQPIASTSDIYRVIIRQIKKKDNKAFFVKALKDDNPFYTDTAVAQALILAGEQAFAQRQFSSERDKFYLGIFVMWEKGGLMWFRAYKIGDVLKKGERVVSVMREAESKKTLALELFRGNLEQKQLKTVFRDLVRRSMAMQVRMPAKIKREFCSRKYIKARVNEHTPGQLSRGTMGQGYPLTRLEARNYVRLANFVLENDGALMKHLLTENYARFSGDDRPANALLNKNGAIEVVLDPISLLLDPGKWNKKQVEMAPWGLCSSTYALAFMIPDLLEIGGGGLEVIDVLIDEFSKYEPKFRGKRWADIGEVEIRALRFWVAMKAMEMAGLSTFNLKDPRLVDEEKDYLERVVDHYGQHAVDLVLDLAQRIDPTVDYDYDSTDKPMQKFLPTKKTAKKVLEKLFSKSDLSLLQRQAKVALCVGMPGSGKTTIAEMLVAAYGYWRFSSDQIRIEELFTDQEHRWANEHEQVMKARYAVYKELTKRTVEALKRGQRIVVDGTNLDDKREMVMKGLLKALVPEKIALVIIKTPEKIMRQRFNLEGGESKRAWQSVYNYWKDYLRSGRASYPIKRDYPGVNLCRVERYDLQTFSWILDIGVIVWDLDGTFYKKIPQMYQRVESFLVESVQKKIGCSQKEADVLFHKMYKKLGSKTMALEHFGLDGRKIFTQCHREIALARYIRKDERLVQLLKQLSQFHHVILTNADRESVERKLRILGLSTRMFSEIFCTYELPYIKPDERVFQHLIKQTSFSPQQHLCVGDVEDTDIVPAKAAGMRTAMVWGTSKVADVSFDEVYGVGRLFGVEV